MGERELRLELWQTRWIPGRGTGRCRPSQLAYIYVMTLRCAFLRCLSNANPILLRLVFLLRVSSLARFRRFRFPSAPSPRPLFPHGVKKRILVQSTAPYTRKRERPPLNFSFGLGVRNRLELRYLSRPIVCQKAF